VRSVWFSPRAIGLHVTVLIVVPTFFALFDWQLHRALAGNGLSWAYVFEWPFFAVYAVYLWWKLVHEPPGTPVDDTPAGSAVAGTDASSGHEPMEATEDDELAAYNRYLAELDAHDRRRGR
jgi:hypothetical protein